MTRNLLQEIHPLNIIREVQKWPALYVKDNTERANMHFKMKIWCEIAKELFPDWATYSKSERNRKNLTKKWRNLRDTFRRQVEIERKIREGADIKKKTYVFYNHMTFLLPHIGDEPREPPSARKRKRCSNDTDSSGEEQESLSRSLPQMRLSRDEPPPSTSVFIEEIDEDKHFVLSLIPSLKKMTEDEKLTTKMEILKVIKGVRTNSQAALTLDSLAFNAVEVIRDDVNIKKEVVLANIDLEEASLDNDEDFS